MGIWDGIEGVVCACLGGYSLLGLKSGRLNYIYNYSYIMVWECCPGIDDLFHDTLPHQLLNRLRLSCLLSTSTHSSTTIIFNRTATIRKCFSSLLSNHLILSTHKIHIIQNVQYNLSISLSSHLHPHCMRIGHAGMLVVRVPRIVVSMQAFPDSFPSINF